MLLSSAVAPLAALPAQAAPSASQPLTANVMAPLDLDNPTVGGNGNGAIDGSEAAAFITQLNTVKGYGVDAVSVDVWWGRTEPSDQNFNWGYYDSLFSLITNAGLKIVPILSFHSCGGNVGDTCNIPLPSWVWSSAGSTNLHYKSEFANESAEYIQAWATSLPAVQTQYTQYIQAFTTHFNPISSSLQEVNISLGPAGELRYPSYNQHDAAVSNPSNGYPVAGWPNRGALQAYSDLAKSSFQNAMLSKYGSLAGLNAAWGTSLTATSQIQPPGDGENFWTSNAYRATAYGKDFVDWYNKSLVDHGTTMMTLSGNAIGSNLAGVPLGYKIPGVHWRMSAGTNPYPRAAEVSAGLVQTSVDMNAASTGRGYARIVGVAKTPLSGGRAIILHFTCLEMSDAEYSGATAQWSQAATLVSWMGAEAARQGVVLKGENALAGGVTSDAGWNNIDGVFANSAYSGLTVLRISDVATGLGQNRYTSFIERYRWPTLFVRGSFNNWGPGFGLVRAANGTWSGTIRTGSASGQAVKFDRSNNWSINYGGSGLSGTASTSGGNIALASSTTYRVTFDPYSLAYSFTVVSNPSTCTVTFGIANANTSTGQNLYAVGNNTALGSWVPANGARMTIIGNGANQPWSGVVTVPLNTALQYKYVKWNGSTATWESNQATGSGNREFTCNASALVRSDGNFSF